jgi:hypothetical protein
MNDLASISAVLTKLVTAETFTDVFGDVPGASVELRRRSLRQSFAHLVKIVHPDHAPEAVKDEAQEAFQLLDTFYRSADRCLENRTYHLKFQKGQPFAVVKPLDKDSVVALQSPTAMYIMSALPTWKGDFSSIYKARIQKGGVRVEDVAVKVSKNPKYNPLLQWEAQVLQRFHNPKGSDSLKAISTFVPKVLDSFLAPGKDGKRFQATVTSLRPGLVSLTEVINAFPMGLDPKDAAWIFRRVLAQVAAAKAVRVVHCCMTPDHILVDPVTHAPLHIGWTHSVDDPLVSRKRIMLTVDRWDYMYPPEVFEKALPDQKTDIFMAGMTMIKLLGGDSNTRKVPSVVPPEVAQSILHCVEESPNRRPSSAVNALERFTKAVRAAWGREYRPLTMPV